MRLYRGCEGALMARDTRRCDGRNPRCRHCRQMAAAPGYILPDENRTPRARASVLAGRQLYRQRPDGPHAKAL